MPIDTTVGETTYHWLQDLACGQTLDYDDLTGVAHGWMSMPNDTYYFFTYLEFGQTIDVHLHTRVHGNLGNGTGAIFHVDAFMGNLTQLKGNGDGTDKHDDYYWSHQNTGPARWAPVYFGQVFFFLDRPPPFGVEFTWTLSNCTFLAGQPGHTPYTIPVATRIRNGSGGWTAGQA